MSSARMTPAECVKLSAEYQVTVFVAKVEDRFQSGFELVCGRTIIVKWLIPHRCESLRTARVFAWSAAHEELSHFMKAESWETPTVPEQLGRLLLKVEDRLQEVKERQMQLFEVPSDAS